MCLTPTTHQSEPRMQSMMPCMIDLCLWAEPPTEGGASVDAPLFLSLYHDFVVLYIDIQVVSVCIKGVARMSCTILEWKDCCCNFYHCWLESNCPKVWRIYESILDMCCYGSVLFLHSFECEFLFFSPFPSCTQFFLYCIIFCSDCIVTSDMVY